jgi:acetoacetyl-CoA synthetase
MLFLELRGGNSLDIRLRERISHALRTELSEPPCSDHIVQAPATPRTLSGKKLEVTHDPAGPARTEREVC